MTTESTTSLPDQAPIWMKYQFPKLVLHIKEVMAANQVEGESLFRQISIEYFIEKMQGVKYPTFLQFLVELINIDNDYLKQILIQLPEEVLINKDHIGNVYNFNKLLYTFHQLQWTDKAELLAKQGIAQAERYIRVNDIRTINSFLYLLGHYEPKEVASLLKQYGRKLFSKITFFVPKTNRDKHRNPIPHLIYLIAQYDMVLAHKLLKHVRYLTNHTEEGNWKELEAPASILGFSYYQVATVYSEQEPPAYGKSNHYLSQAIGCFEDLNHKAGLCVSNFLWAKNTYATTQDATYTQLLAKRASLYAKEAELEVRLEEINAFLEKIKG